MNYFNRFSFQVAALSVFIMVCGFSFSSFDYYSGPPFINPLGYESNGKNPTSTTVLIDSSGDGGFENGSVFADNGWTVVNGTYNRFHLGDAPGGYSGNRCAFTGQNSSTWSGSSNLAVNHFYRDVNFPASEPVILLRFKYKVSAASGSNNLKIYVIPTSVTPSAGTELTSGQVGNSYNSSTSWRDTSIYIPSYYAGTTKRIVFSWKHNVSETKVVAVDNIYLTTNTPVPLTGTKTIGAGGDYPDFVSAFEQLNMNGAGSGGVTFNVASGQVFDHSGLKLYASGTLSNPIKFKKTGTGANPLIRHNGNLSSDFAGIWINGGDYILFDGIDIGRSNSSSSIQYGYYINNFSSSDGAKYDTIRNCSVTLYSSQDFKGILQRNDSTPSGANGTNSFNSYVNLNIKYAGIGIELTGNEPYHDSMNVVSNSDIYSIGDNMGNTNDSTFGVWLWNQSKFTFSNNSVHDISYYYGYCTPAGIFVNRFFDTSIISGNKIYDIKGSDCLGAKGIDCGPAGVSGSVLRIYNNFIYGINGNKGSLFENSYSHGIYVYGYGVSFQWEADIDFNTVIINSSSHSSCLEMQNIALNKIRNNIFSNMSVAGIYSENRITCVDFYDNDSVGTAGSVSDNNAFYIKDLNKGYLSYHGYSKDIYQWRDRYHQDYNSYSQKPMLVSDTDYHILSLPTPVSNNGSYFSGAISWAGKDLDGETRNALTPDIGADEGSFTNLYSNDLAVYQLLYYENGIYFQGDTSVFLSAYCENHGTSDRLNAPFRIFIKDSSNTTVFDTTITFDTLRAGITKILNTDTFSVSSNGLNRIYAVAQSTGDQYRNNDTAKGFFYIKGTGFSGDYYVGANHNYPFNSIQNAVTVMRNDGVTGPVRLLLDDINYDGNISVFNIPGASAVNNVTIRKSGTERPVLKISGYYGGIRIYECSYLTFEDLIIRQDSADTEAGYGIIVGHNTSPYDGCSHLTVKNCSIEFTDTTRYHYGVYFKDNFASVTNSYNKFISDTVKNASAGFVLNGKNILADTLNEISGCVLKGLRRKGTDGNINGIESMYQVNLEIYGNTMSNFTSDDAWGSVIGYHAGTGTENFEFYNNKLSGFHSLYELYAVYIEQATVANIYSNEFFDFYYDVGGFSSGKYMIYNSGTIDKLNIHGNVLYNINNLNGIISNNYSTDTVNIYGNNIYGIYDTLNSLNVISLNKSNTANFYNNVITGIHAPKYDVTGILIGNEGGKVRVFYNTVFLNDSSVRTEQVTAAIKTPHDGTLDSIDIRNNIFVNKTNISGGTRAVAHLRTGASLSNLSPEIDNNLYYAGNPSGKNLIYYNGTNKDSVISQYKTRMGTKEVHSISENPHFISESGVYNMHPDTLYNTGIESGGKIISYPFPVIIDIDSVKRYPNPGYPVHPDFIPVAPDIGAFEFGGKGTENVPPVITYTLLPNTSSSSNRVLSAVISDTTGVPVTGSLIPRIYFKKYFNGTWYSSAGTIASGNGRTGTWNFTVTNSTLGGVTAGDTVFYFIIAQDSSSRNNIGANPGAGLVAADVNTISSYPSNPNYYKILNSISGTYHIGFGKTFPDLDSAVKRYNNSQITSPVTFILDDAVDSSFKNGSSVFPVTINEIPGQSFTNMLTIRPNTGMSVLISGNSEEGIIKLNSADYITIDGSNSGGSDRSLIISDSNTTGNPSTIILSSPGDGAGARRNTVKNCIISSSVASSMYNECINVDGKGNDSLTIHNNKLINASSGIVVNGLFEGSSYLTISQNIIGDSLNIIKRTGIDLEKVNYCNITQNRIFNIRSGNSTPVGINLYQNCNNINITRNDIDSIIHTGEVLGGGKGIVVNTTYGGSNITIDNNVIYNISGRGFNTVTDATSGISILGTTGGVNVYYNSVNLYGNISRPSATDDFSSAISIAVSCTGLDIRNNIFSNSIANTAGISTAYAIYCLAPNTAFSQCNYNFYYASGAEGVLGYLGGNKTTIEQWRTATGKDGGSIDWNPVFVSNSNLKLYNGSPAFNWSIPIPGFLTDYMGLSRGLATTTTGAFEYKYDEQGPQITYTPLTYSNNYSGRTLSGVIITDSSAVDTSSANKPRIYYRRTSDTNTYIGNSSSAKGWKYSELQSQSDSVYSFYIDYSKFFGGGNVTEGDTVCYFVTAMDKYILPNVSINSGTFASQPASLNLDSTAFPVTGSVNKYPVIAAPLSGDYEISLPKYNQSAGRNVYFESKFEKKEVTETLFESRNKTGRESNDMSKSSVETDNLKQKTKIINRRIAVPYEKNNPVKGLLFYENTERGLSGKDNYSGTFATITSAIEALHMRGVSGPVRFLLSDSVYCSSETFPLTVNQVNGASRTNNITFRPSDGKSVLISGNASPSVFKLNGADYITIDGSNSGGTDRHLTIIDSSSSSIASVFISSLGVNRGASGNTVKNCIISTGTNNGLVYNYCIFAGGDSLDYSGAGSNNDTLTIENNLLFKSHFGIYISGTSPDVNRNVKIINNVLGDTANHLCSGIFIRGSNGVEIRNNHIFNIRWNVADPFGIMIRTYVSNASVSGNKIDTVKYTGTDGWGGKGIMVYTFMPSSPLSSVNIYNNVINNILGDGWNDMRYGIQGIGIDGYSRGVNVYYNSVNLRGTISRSGASNDKSAGMFVAENCSGINIRNNVFSNSLYNQSGTATAYAIYSGVLDTSFSNIDYNDYYAFNSQGILGYMSSNRTTITDWRLATGRDTHSVSADPKFLSADIMIPAGGSPLIYSGVPVSGITTDYLGDTRDPVHPSIGAYERYYDNSAPDISYTPLPNTKSETNRTFSGITISDSSGVDTASGKKARLYYRRHNDVNTYKGNTSSTAGWKYSEPSEISGSAYTFIIDYSRLHGSKGSVSPLDTIYYFIVAQDVYYTPHVSIKTGTFANQPSDVALTSGAFPVTGTNKYHIVGAPISGDFTVGLGAFKEATGLNISFEKRYRKKDIKQTNTEITKNENISKKISNKEINSGNNEKIDTKEDSNKPANENPDRTNKETGMYEPYKVPVLNGKEYSGVLYADYNSSVNTGIKSDYAPKGVFATITAAINELNDRGVNGPVRLLLLDSLYSDNETFPLSISAIAGVNSSNTITVKPFTGVNSKIYCDTSLTLLKIISTGYITIDGSNSASGSTKNLTFESAVSNMMTGTRSVHIGSDGSDSAHNITLKNIIIRSSGKYDEGSAILLSGISGYWTAGLFSNIYIENNEIYRASSGVLISGAYGSGNFYLRNNLINGTGVNSLRDFGISIKGVRFVEIKNNKIGNIDTDSGMECGGIYLNGSDTCFVIESNEIYNIGRLGEFSMRSGCGIKIEDYSPASGDFLIRNNVIRNIFGQGSMMSYPSGIAVTGSISGVRIFNNSINLYGNTLNWFGAVSAGIFLNGSSPEIKNNCIVNNLGVKPGSTGDGYSAGICFMNSFDSLINLDYNNYYVSATGTGTNYVVMIYDWMNPVYFPNLTDWKNYSKKDLNSYNGNPGYLSNDNLLPDTTSSGCRNLYMNGMPLSFVSTDYRGLPRSASAVNGPVCIGAYEFVAAINPPVAAFSGPPVAADTTIYSQSEHKLLEIIWGASFDNGNKLRNEEKTKAPVIKKNEAFKPGNIPKDNSKIKTPKDATPKDATPKDNNKINTPQNSPKDAAPKDNVKKSGLQSGGERESGPMSFPTVVNVQFFSGLHPPDLPSIAYKHGHGFWYVDVDANPASPVSLTIYYGAEQLGDISPEADMILAKYDSTTRVWVPFKKGTTGDGVSIINTTSKTITVNGITELDRSVWALTQDASAFTRLKLDIDVLIQGLYFDGGLPGYQVRDTVTVILRDSANSWAQTDSVRIPLDSLGHGVMYTSASVTGHNYYIVIRHRNAIETWSSLGNKAFSLITGRNEFNFTTSQDQAYGGNMLLKNGKYCIFSGDVSNSLGQYGVQDGFIDGNDNVLIFTDAENFTGGWVVSDLNGDEFVDGNDDVICFNNAENFIGVIKPPDAPWFLKISRGIYDRRILIKKSSEEQKKY